MNLPDFPNNDEAKLALRRVSLALSESGHLPFEAQKFELHQAGLSGVSADVIGDFANGVTRKPSTRQLLKEMWKLFARHSPALLLAQYESAIAELRVGSDPLTNALCHFWRPSQPIDTFMLEKLSGHYAVFFPFFSDPSKLLIAVMECGADQNLAKFRLVENYTEYGRRERTDIIEGRIIPTGDTVMFVGQIVGQDTPFIFALFGFPTTNGKVEWSEGATLVAARGVRPSAYPVFIVRRDEPPQPRVISHAEAADEIIEWPEVERVLSHGMVKWRKAGEPA
jgi:hypothetical protein